MTDANMRASGTSPARKKTIGGFFTKVASAVLLLEAFDWVFTFVFIPGMNIIFGLWWGGAISFATAFLLNYVLVLLYKRTKTDWFGMETARAYAALEATGWRGKLVRWGYHRSKYLAFPLICMAWDPLPGFAFIHGRTDGSRFSLRDWGWFLLANIFGVIPWVLGAEGVIELVEMLFNFL